MSQNKSAKQVMPDVVFLNTHPIQYFAPMYKYLQGTEGLNITTLYCSDESIKGHTDVDFGIKVKWDIPLLEGYTPIFLKNLRPNGSNAKGFFGLINLSVIKYLIKYRQSLWVIHGWHRFTLFFALLVGRILGVNICLRSDNPVNQELKKSKKIIAIKKIFFSKFLFRLPKKLMYVGNQNKGFYQFYGVPNHKLIFVPHCVDNKRLQTEQASFGSKSDLKLILGLLPNVKYILFSGKIFSKKKPEDLLEAFIAINNPEFGLIYMGTGELHSQLENKAKQSGVQNIHFVGFKNQSEISKYLSASDLLVLPSGSGETWGLVVNEALAMGLPVITSDLVGSAYDLIDEGVNGFMVEYANLAKLQSAINQALTNDAWLENASKRSLQIIEDYSYLKVANAIKSLLNK